MLNSIISRLSSEKYDIITSNIIAKLENSIYSDGKNTDNIIFLIHLVDIFLHNSSYGKYYNFKIILKDLASFFFF